MTQASETDSANLELKRSPISDAQRTNLLDDALRPPAEASSSIASTMRMESTASGYLPRLELAEKSQFAPGAFFDPAAESNLATGAKVTLSVDGKPTHVARTGGSSVTVENNRIVERSKDNKVTAEWTRSETGWVSASNPEKIIKSVQLDKNGNLTTEIADGTKHTITGQGAHFIGREISFDDQGRIKQINYPDGRIRAFGYEGNSLEPKSLVSRAPGSSEWKFFIKTDTNTWSNCDEKGTVQSVWKGEVRLSQDGLYGTKSATDRPDSPWSVTRLDGSLAERTAFRASDALTSTTTNLESARAEFLREARRHSADISKLTQYADGLEQSCADRSQRGLITPTADQLSKTYEHLTELLKGPATRGGRNDQARSELAALTLYNLGHANKIDQGLNLCNITTAEVFTAARHPENYARLIKEVALTGEYKTTSGNIVKPPAGSIERDQENARFTPETVGDNRWRNWASKVFQETGINSVVPYLKPNSEFPAWGKPHVQGKSDMHMEQIQAACTEINKQKMPYFGISDAPTAAELLQLKERGDFPAGIHTVHVTDQNGVVAGLHVQTIQDVRMRQGNVEVYLDNQRGGVQDAGWISLNQLYQYQQLAAPAEHFAVPPKYQGKTFDTLQPEHPTVPEQRKEAAPTVNPVRPIKPPDATENQGAERERRTEPTPKPPVRNESKDSSEERAKPSDQTESSKPPSIIEARRQLETALDQGIHASIFKTKRERKAHEILDNFEKRCADDRKSGLVAPSDQQIANAYIAAYKTLTEPGIMPYEDRHKMVLEGLRNVSDPRGIDQGWHGTCGNTCGEIFIAVRNPDVYMSALQQVAARGSVTGTDGREIKLPHDDLRQGYLGQTLMQWQRGWKPDSEARNWDVYKEIGWHPLHSNETRRNYASQIMQNLALADALESGRQGQQGPGVVDALTFLHVESFTKRMTGTPITTINQAIQSEGNIQQPLTDPLALQLKRDGRLPAMVWRAAHWQTIHDVRTVQGRDVYGRSVPVVQVLSDNQWGNYRDRGWETVPQLHAELAEPGF